MKIYGFLVLILTFISCQYDSDKLFCINENSESKDDFMFVAESINILPISSDSVRMFLKWDEIRETKYLESQIYTNDTILPSPVIFKDYGEIYKSDKFKLHVIFRDGNDTISRDYKFILRTYSLDWNIIDSYDLAVWNKKIDKYCIGSINKKLIIEKNCNNSEYSEIMQILENGKIVMTSFNKP